MQNIQTHKEGEREGEIASQSKIKRGRLIRQSLGGHGNAQKAHMDKEGRGCGMDSEGPPHAHESRSVYNA